MAEIHSLAVFCGSRVGASPAFRDAAQALGRRMVERGIRLVYGGGGIGLMGVVAQAMLARGGVVTGVIPDFLMKPEVGNPGVTELIVVDSMHERKRRMFELVDACVVLPGGLGTLDETIEIVTWRQLRLHAKPVVVLDIDGYWGALGALVDHVIAHGFASPAVRELFEMVPDVDAAFAYLDAAPAAQPSASSDYL